MDTATLVNEQIDDGTKFVAHLRKSGFDVVVAVWVLTSEDALWFLYIASPEVDSNGLAAAYRKAYSELSRSQLSSISRSDIKLIGSHDPLALDAIAYRNDKFPTRFGGRKLGNMIIEEAFIYPKLD
jgi:hypothetical protein